MRRTIAALMESRILGMKKQTWSSEQAFNEAVKDVQEKFIFIDRSLSGVMFGPEGKIQHADSKLAEAMVTADFTYAILEFVQRQMWPSYEKKNFNFEPFVKPDTLPNFQNVTRYQQREGADDLEYKQEKGEARAGSRADAVKKQYRVYEWEKQFDFSMQLLVNDDLGYFDDQAMEMGKAARRTLEKYVSRMLWNATTIARLTGLGALYSGTGRLTTANISTARMGFNQRADGAGEPVNASLRFIVYHSGLEDTVATIQSSTLVPELATNAANVVAGKFTPIEDPYLAGTAPNLPWMGLADYNENNIIPFVLARRQGVPGPILMRKKSNIESFASFAGAGGQLSPIWGDFETNNVVVKVHDEWGTYIDDTEGNLVDFRGAYYSNGTTP